MIIEFVRGMHYYYTSRSKAKKHSYMCNILKLFIRLQKEGDSKGTHIAIPHLLVAHPRQPCLNQFCIGPAQGRRR